MSINNTLFIERQVFCSLRKCCKELDLDCPEDLDDVRSALWPPVSEPNASQNSQNSQNNTPTILHIEWARDPVYNTRSYTLSDLFLISMIIRNFEGGHWESQTRPQNPNSNSNDAAAAICTINLLIIVLGIILISGTLGEWCHLTVESLKHSRIRKRNLLSARNALQSCEPGNRERCIQTSLEKALILEKQNRKMQIIKLAAAIMLTIGAIILTLSFVVCSTMAIIPAVPGTLIGIYAIVAGATSGGLILTAITMLTARRFAMRKAGYDAIFQEGYRHLSDIAAEPRNGTSDR